MAKESTSQEILSNTKKIIEDAKAKPKRYGMRINLLDSNPATRVKYLYDAVGMTPAGMNFAGGGFDYGDWGDIWFVTASPTTVYQRRNIKKATKEDADGKKITGWQREEREMSREEYDRLTLMQEVVASNTTGIVESVTQFQKDAVIDEYTQQLIEEGLI